MSFVNISWFEKVGGGGPKTWIRILYISFGSGSADPYLRIIDSDPGTQIITAIRLYWHPTHIFVAIGKMFSEQKKGSNHTHLFCSILLNINK
jgi:hypothetical protein